MSNYFLHPQALVETSHIGDNSYIWAFVHILKGAKIGKNVNICDHCFVEDRVIIGDNVTIKSGVYIWNSITIEDDVHIGASVTFTNDVYPRSKNHNWIEDKTLIKKGSSLGANATILPKITIGKYAMIGAGSVVTKDIPDFAIAYGNPAKIKGYICVCGKKMVFQKDFFNCSCNRIFKKTQEKVEFLKCVPITS